MELDSIASLTIWSSYLDLLWGMLILRIWVSSYWLVLFWPCLTYLD